MIEGHDRRLKADVVQLAGGGGAGGAFNTPRLREVARTAPHMHDGTFVTLTEVVDFYDRGGAANPGLDPQLRPLKLTAAEKRDLILPGFVVRKSP